MVLELDPVPKQESTPPHPTLAIRPVLILAALALLVGIVGFVVVARRTATMYPSGDSRGWDGVMGALLGEPGHIQAPSYELGKPMEQGGSGSSNTYDLPRITSDASPSSAVQTDSDALTYQALLSDLQRYVPRSTGSAPPPSSVTSVTYAFPPAGIISTTTSGSRETRTKVQQELFEYGNAIGSYIQSFEEAHSNQVQVLKDQLEDRTNPAKNAAVVQLGKAMQNLGNNLRGVQEVPSAIADAHEALANSYIEIGKNLALVPAAQDTDALLKAINVYNASAGTFAQNFAALATRFVENDISFGQTDPGVVFQFSYQNASVQ